MTGHVSVVIQEPGTGRWLVDCQEYGCLFRTWNVNEGNAADEALYHELRTERQGWCDCYSQDGHTEYTGVCARHEGQESA